MFFEYVVRFLTPTLAFANITSGLGTGMHKDTDAAPGPSSESLNATAATSQPQPIPEISTVHLIHVKATCRFDKLKSLATAYIPF